jgi:hypothetical protein
MRFDERIFGLEKNDSLSTVTRNSVRDREYFSDKNTFNMVNFPSLFFSKVEHAVISMSNCPRNENNVSLKRECRLN